MGGNERNKKGEERRKGRNRSGTEESPTNGIREPQQRGMEAAETEWKRGGIKRVGTEQTRDMTRGWCE